MLVISDVDERTLRRGMESVATPTMPTPRIGLMPFGAPPLGAAYIAPLDARTLGSML